MAMRCCAYNGCKNFMWKGKQSGKFFLFEFPKNENLRNEWIIMGKVKDYDPNCVYYMCSNHFDKKLISVHNRHVTLDENAIPNAYISIDLKLDGGKTNSMETKYTEQDNCTVKEDDIKKNITKLRDENGKNSECGITENYIFLPSDKLELVPKDSNNDEIQVFNITGISPVKDRSAMEPTEHVKIFMFKGTEYIEMSKNYYLLEKANLMEELERYKSFVTKVKSEYCDFKYNQTNK